MGPYDGGTFIAKREKFSQNELINIGYWELGGKRNRDKTGASAYCTGCTRNNFQKIKKFLPSRHPHQNFQKLLLRTAERTAVAPLQPLCDAARMENMRTGQHAP